MVSLKFLLAKKQNKISSFFFIFLFFLTFLKNCAENVKNVMNNYEINGFIETQHSQLAGKEISL